MKRAAIYCRVSTDLEIQEGSFEAQKAYYIKMIRDNPSLTLVDVYGDYAKSGTSMRRRPEFLRLLRDCEEGKIDVVYTKSISRFARSAADCVDTVRRLTSLGVSVVFEREGLNTADASSEFVFAILAAVAAEEVNSLRQNMLWGLEELNASGRPSFRPSYGYVRGENRSWRIDSEAAERVRLAFGMAAQGATYDEILAALNACELQKGSGYRWNKTRLRYMLTNISYTGDVITNKYYKTAAGTCAKKNNGERPQYHIENHHPAIVSREVFDRVQLYCRSGLLRSNRRGGLCDFAKLSDSQANRCVGGITANAGY